MKLSEFPLQDKVEKPDRAKQHIEFMERGVGLVQRNEWTVTC